MSATLATSPDADDLIRDGLVASRDDQVDVALALFHRAASLAPHSGVPHFLIGAELAQSGRADEAEAAFATAVLLAPELDMARYQLGLLQFTSGRVAVALLTWGPLFARGPEVALHHVVRGFAALAQDDPAQAAECIQRAMALNHDNPPLNHDLQGLLNRIAASQQATSSGAQEDGRAEDESQHVLLSNYQRHGPLH